MKSATDESFAETQNISTCSTQTPLSKTLTQFFISLILTACHSGTLAMLVVVPLINGSFEFCFFCFSFHIGICKTCQENQACGHLQRNAKVPRNYKAGIVC